MITEFEIENFRCFKNVKVPLKPFTVLIGQNDSGKSNFLAALQTAVTGGRANQLNDGWIGGEAGDIQFRIRTSKWWDYGMSIEELQPVALYQLPSTGITMSSSGHSEEEGGEAPKFLHDGSNLPAILDHILRTDRERFNRIVSTMSAHVPGFVDISVLTPEASKRELEFRIEKEYKLHAAASSAGVRMILFFVTLAYLPQPPKVVLIEEPETGVHSKRLGEIVKLLRALTIGDYGNQKAQVVLSTHSPYLLDYVDPATDQVLVFRRSENGSRTVEPADVDGLRKFLEDFMLGEIWFNRGEAGLVKPSKE